MRRFIESIKDLPYLLLAVLLKLIIDTCGEGAETE